LFALLERGAIRIAIDIQKEQADLRALMHRYRNRLMSLADACLVRLLELDATGGGLYAGFRLSHLPPPRQQNDPRIDAGLNRLAPRRGSFRPIFRW
jgi:hypothetical protein